MSKKRKGVSYEEKRTRILGIYHEKKEVLNLKELEKLGVKQGVVVQSIKEVNQALVDDNLVDTDKIGSANFFWSFPSKVAELLGAGRHDTPQRRAQLQKLQDEKAREAALDQRLDTLKENDPRELARIETETEKCKEAANRWTDNIWALKSWCIKKKGMASTEVDRYLQLSSDFDYVS
uniref:Meiotic nuclear division protein 1 homolog n=1 Tax=Heterosigma akashiwo TaxID=2829 RepID=A0A7S3XLC7_HETAK